MISPGAPATGPNGSGGPAVGNQVGLGSVVEGKVFVEVVDALLPALIVLAFHKGGMVVKKTDMQLTAKERDVLTPIVQRCMDQIMLNFESPWTVLAVTALGIYGSKIAEHGGKAWTDKKAAEMASKKATEAKSKTSQEAPPRHPQTRTDGQAPVVDMKPKDDLWVPHDGTSPDGPIGPADLPIGLPPWGATELAKVKNRRKRGHEDAVEWLNENWAKKGGVI
jgi:hypothetical protein